jgi:hypothetical protein
MNKTIILIIILIGLTLGCTKYSNSIPVENCQLFDYHESSVESYEVIGYSKATRTLSFDGMVFIAKDKIGQIITFPVGGDFIVLIGVGCPQTTGR